MSIHKNKKGGFTLIETMVAVTLLTIAIEAPLVLAARGISTSNYSGNQIVAQYLAQEGLEMVRLTRDNNSLNARDWMSGPSGIGACIPSDGSIIKCIVNAWDGTFTPCSGSCPNLQYNDVSKRYGQGQIGWSDSIFRREITLGYVAGETDDNGSNYELRATSTVYWKNGSIPGEQHVSVSENFFNWKPGL
jgi:prepilin-type N-terminal cleavage/methylation domain-containing protein